MAQVWEVPQPPGDEVTDVVDRHGVRWCHDVQVWWGDRHGDGIATYLSWFELLGRGPLTDVTGEVA